jgi:hypothetical protein
VNGPDHLTAASSVEQVGALCGISPEVAIEAAQLRGCRPDGVLLSALVAWVSAHLELPGVQELPGIRFATPDELASVRFGGSLSEHHLGVVEAGAPTTHHQHDIAALYEDATQTIYLREGWTGATPAELSILVHELVHHVQNLAGLAYACPGSREKPAYATQERWLALFGQTLESEFSLDPMTVLVRTVCAL